MENNETTKAKKPLTKQKMVAWVTGGVALTTAATLGVIFGLQYFEAEARKTQYADLIAEAEQLNTETSNAGKQFEQLLTDIGAAKIATDSLLEQLEPVLNASTSLLGEEELTVLKEAVADLELHSDPITVEEEQAQLAVTVPSPVTITTETGDISQQQVDNAQVLVNLAHKTTKTAQQAVASAQQVLDGFNTEAIDSALEAVAGTTKAKGEAHLAAHPKASAATRTQLTEAISALNPESGAEGAADTTEVEEVSQVELLSNYLTAANAVKTSHTNNVAAERNNNGNRGGSGGGGSGGGGGGGSGSTGGGGGGGGNPPTCGGNQENACVKTPPTFTKNEHFVPYSQCGRFAWILSHNVGYHGNSRTGGTLMYPWSAYVEGPTVHYGQCR